MPRCQFILEDGTHCDQTVVYNNLCLKHLKSDDGADRAEAIAKKVTAFAGATAAILNLVDIFFKVLGPHIKMQGRGDIDLEFIQEQANFIINMANSTGIDASTLDAIHDIYIVLDKEMEALAQQMAGMAVAYEAKQGKKETQVS
jgi:hypothetical protein